VKAKNAVQRSVTALLDELAPERVLKRVDQVPGPIEQTRTPTGCVLQAATAAVTVSWFAGGGNDAALGELHVLIWQGIVARRGARRRGNAASMVSELVLRPIEPLAEECLWRGTDGVQYDTAALAAKCIALLEAQIALPTKSPAAPTNEPQSDKER